MSTADEWRHGISWQWLQVYNSQGFRDREFLLKANLAEVGTNCCIRAPFFCEMGENIYLGNDVYMNFNCTLLDVTRIQIGNGTMFGPGVQVYTAYHEKDPADPEGLRHGDTQAKAVFIGEKVWVGGGAIILPGVQIGDGATIGAGSIVTRNVPAGVTVKGNPAK